MCQGMAESALGEEDAPDHVTLWRRINAMEIRQEDNITTVRNGNDVLCLIPDATGLAPATRSDWIHHKHRKARGFIKLSVMINQETREILAFRVTDERKGDSSQFKDLVDGSLEALGLDSESLRAGVLAKGAAKAQGTGAAAAGSRAERSAAGGTRATDTAGSAERYGMLPFCPAMHAGGQSVIELRRLRPAVAGGDRVLVAQADVRRFRKRGKDGKHRPGDRNKDQHVQQAVGGGTGGDRRSMNVELSQAPALGSRRCH